MRKIVAIAVRHPTEPNMYLHGLRADNHKWALAGGHAKPGEADHEAASRELEEETGIKGVKLDKLHDHKYGDTHVHLFSCEYPGQELSSQNDPDSEFVTFKFLDPTSHENLHIPKERNILVNWMKNSLTKGLRGDWQKEGYNVHVKHQGDDYLIIHANDKSGQYAGHARFDVLPGGKLYPGWTRILEPHQRKGLATAMYSLAEKHSGLKIDSTEIRSKDADALWANPNRPFGKAESLNKAAKIKVEPFVADPQAFNPRKHDFIVRAMRGGKQVGILAVTHHPSGGLMPFNFEVNKLHRRKGIGSAMAVHAQKISGKKIVRSPDMTQDAHGWANSFLGQANMKKAEEEAHPLVLSYPITIGGQSNREDGSQMRMVIKDFGPVMDQDYANISMNLDQQGLNNPIDPRKLMFVPHILQNLGGEKHHVLVVHGLHPKLDAIKQSTVKPHIVIDDKTWDHLSSVGKALTAKDVDIKIHPAELSRGGQVLKTY